jgi:hypothetical protein
MQRPAWRCSSAELLLLVDLLPVLEPDLGTGRRAGSSRSRWFRKPWGSATGSLHDPVPDLRAVEVEALGLRLGTDVEDALVVAGSTSEKRDQRVPVGQQPGATADSVHWSGVRRGARDACRSSGRRGEVDELGVDQFRREVEDVGHSPGHPGREVAARWAEDQDGATGHVLAAVVTDALDDGGRARVAHAEPLAGDAAQEDLAGGGAVADDVAGDDVLLGDEVPIPAGGP